MRWREDDDEWALLRKSTPAISKKLKAHNLFDLDEALVAVRWMRHCGEEV
jgi:hypothetical protein